MKKLTDIRVFMKNANAIAYNENNEDIYDINIIPFFEESEYKKRDGEILTIEQVLDYLIDCMESNKLVYIESDITWSHHFIAKGSDISHIRTSYKTIN